MEWKHRRVRLHRLEPSAGPVAPGQLCGVYLRRAGLRPGRVFLGDRQPTRVYRNEGGLHESAERHQRPKPHPDRLGDPIRHDDAISNLDPAANEHHAAQPDPATHGHTLAHGDGNPHPETEVNKNPRPRERGLMIFRIVFYWPRFFCSSVRASRSSCSRDTVLLRRLSDCCFLRSLAFSIASRSAISMAVGSGSAGAAASSWAS